jgi:hypothetical protein
MTRRIPCPPASGRFEGFAASLTISSPTWPSGKAAAPCCSGCGHENATGPSPLLRPARSDSLSCGNARTGLVCALPWRLPGRGVHLTAGRGGGKMRPVGARSGRISLGGRERTACEGDPAALRRYIGGGQLGRCASIFHVVRAPLRASAAPGGTAKGRQTPTEAFGNGRESGKAPTLILYDPAEAGGDARR